MVDAEQPMDHGRADLVVLGLRFRIAAGHGAARTHYVSDARSPLPGLLLRRVGLSATGGACHGELVLTADRRPYTTVAGGGGLALLLLSLVCVVVFARRRRGGWIRRFLIAAPAGVVAGLGEALLLNETGAISPFSTRGWWLPWAGLLLAALLPLTRARRGTATTARNGPAEVEATATAAVVPPGGWPGPTVPEDAGPAPVPDQTLPGLAQPEPQPEPTQTHNLMITSSQATPPPGPSAEARRPNLAGRLTTIAAITLLVAAGLGAAIAVRPSPAQAAAEVVTPAGAKLIFSSMWGQARAHHYDRLDGAAELFGCGSFAGQQLQAWGTVSLS